MGDAEDPSGSPDQHKFTIGDRPPSLAVVESIAQLNDDDPASLPHLANHADPEALDKFIAGSNEGVVHFEYDGFEVNVYSSGNLLIK